MSSRSPKGGYRVHGVQALEQFRTRIRGQLDTEGQTKLQHALLSTAAPHMPEEPLTMTPNTMTLDDLKRDLKQLKDPVKAAKKLKRRWYQLTSLPPQFLMGIETNACTLAFKNAHSGKPTMIREGLVGVIHYEGRLAEELIRISKDGTLRLFTPYDCDKPRLNLVSYQISSIEAVDGLFLGRFYRFRIETFVLQLILCLPDEQSRDDWLHACTSWKQACDDMDRLSKENSEARQSHLSEETVELSDQITSFLTDTTRAKRWRPKNRIVLNNRILLDDTACPQPSISESLLEKALALGEDPTLKDLSDFMDSTCLLKAVRLENCSQKELLAFWLNVYHCLMIHGRLLVSTPKSRSELGNFQSRVSYLVELRPLSVREIERIILQLPNPDSRVRAAGKAHAKSFLACCWGRRPRRSRSSRRGDEGLSSASSGADSDSLEGAPGKLAPRCFPTMNMALPTAPWRPVTLYACLFLGYSPGPLSVPRLDMRVCLCMNRMNMSCPKTVPVFCRDLCEDQMNEVARRFIAQYSSFRDAGGGQASRVTMPHICKCLKRELMPEAMTFLNFVWQFMSTPGPPEKVLLKFEKYRPAPRQLSEIARIERDGIFKSQGENAEEDDCVVAREVEANKFSEAIAMKARGIVIQPSRFEH